VRSAARAGFAAGGKRILLENLCEWPLVPRYRSGDMNAAASFACAP